MKASEVGSPVGPDRVKGLLAWWGLPNIGREAGLEAQTNRLQAMVVDLNDLFREALSSQARAVSAADEQLTSALQDFLSAQRPPELVAAQSRLVTLLLSSVAAQAKALAELTQKVCNTCGVMVGEAAIESPKHSGSDLPTRARGADKQPAGSKAGRRAHKGQ